MPKANPPTLQNSTNGLTKAGEKLLFALSDPENYLLSVSALCEKAKIHRTTYYNLYESEKFRDKAVDLAKAIFATSTPAVARKVAEQAVDGSATHQRIILEATGVIQPTGMPVIAQQFNVGGKMDLEFIGEGEK